MKQIFLWMGAAALFAACSQPANETTGREIQLLKDSAAFVNNNVYSDSPAGASNQPAPEENASVATPAPKPVVTKSRPKVQARPVPAPQPAPEPAPQTPPVVQQTEAQAPVPAEVPVATAPAPEKKGWNKATEGAVIGGAVGAVGGAIISKKKGLGAVVGGVAGAAGGYIIGKNKDKKAREKADSTKQ